MPVSYWLRFIVPILIITCICYYNIFFLILSVFSLDSGCLFPSLPSDVSYDQNTGISFVCDLNDNLEASWPSTSFVPASSCNQSMLQMLYFPFLFQTIFSSNLKQFVYIAVVAVYPPYSTPPSILFQFYVETDLFLHKMYMQLSKFLCSLRQHLHKVVSGQFYLNY